MSLTRTAACLIVALVSTAPAHAQSSDIPDIQADDPQRPKWEAGVAGVALTTPDYPASDHYQRLALPAPYFVYHGRVFRSDEQGSRLRRALTPNIELSMSGGGALSTDSSDTDAREGMPDLDYLLELGPNLKMSFEAPGTESQFVINLPIRGVISVDSSGADWRGALFAPEFAYQERRLMNTPLSLRVSLGLEYSSTLLQRYFYEVEPRYATADRPAYQADSGLLDASLGARLSLPLSPNVRGFVALRYYRYGGAANEDSPLFRDDDGYTAVIGFSWTLLRSRERAAD
ncbi:MAG: MipA/OmpV family protein [Gammaproteobacteria bacterium]|nr:MipA/OmpV family protein [Gammaproteobacteria bacterium]